jgi:hypothetical protein
MHQEYFTSASSNSIFHIQMQTFGSAKISAPKRVHLYMEQSFITGVALALLWRSISQSQGQHLPTDTVCIDDQTGAS